MKKLYILAVLFIGLTITAQVTIEPSSWDINSESITINYGPVFDLWDPAGAATIYAYTGVDTDGDLSTWDYHDDWTDLATQVELTLDASSGVYSGTLTLANKNWVEEANPSNVGPIPAGTAVNEFFFLLRNDVGGAGNQSADLNGSDFGFEVSTLSIDDVRTLETQFKISNGYLYTLASQAKEIKIFDSLGRMIKSVMLDGRDKIDLKLGSGQYFVLADTGESLKCLIP